MFDVCVLRGGVSWPSTVFSVRFHARRRILRKVRGRTVTFLTLPLLSFTVSVVVGRGRLAIVLRRVVDVGTRLPNVDVVISTRRPETRLITNGVNVLAFAVVVSAEGGDVPRSLWSAFYDLTFRSTVSVVNM